MTRDQLTFGDLSAPAPASAEPATSSVSAAPTTPATAPAATAPAATAPAAKPRRYGVGELVREAQRFVEARFPSIYVEGEISNLRQPQSGHFYFTLKDAEGQLAAVMFRAQARAVKFALRDGLKIICRGRLSIYDAQGKFQLLVDAMRPQGAGELQLAFEQLKAKLAAEGLFAPSRKRPLPFLPRRIGVVTSPTGAAVQDLIRVVHRRFPARLLIAPAAVQGADAPVELCRALRALGRARGVDVIILCRGGGSMEDLWAFNDESLARAIAASPVPVISAVGHETDFTIADFVADLRVATPSAAGERVVPMASELAGELGTLKIRLLRAQRRILRDGRLAQQVLERRLGSPRRSVEKARQRLDDLLGRAEAVLAKRFRRARGELSMADAKLARLHPQARLSTLRDSLGRFEARLLAGLRQALDRRRARFETAVGQLQALSPLGILARGYALARLSEGGEVITDPAQAPEGTEVDVLLAKGELHCVVAPKGGRNS